VAVGGKRSKRSPSISCQHYKDDGFVIDAEEAKGLLGFTFTAI
jgi:hypothetical protein